MLAAEMIFRGNDVWARIGGNIAERIRRWHKPEESIEPSAS